jgi:hypothetical protein
MQNKNKTSSRKRTHLGKDKNVRREYEKSKTNS